VTNTPVRRYCEAFISYGPHSNTKLYTEYGFTIPDNPHDFFPVHLTDIRSFLTQQQLEPAHVLCWKEKVNILTTLSHLADNLGITAGDGLSWSLKAALRIVHMDTTELDNWSSIYQDDEETLSGKYLADFTRYLLQRLQNNLSQMRALCHTTKDFSIAIDLVASQVQLLENTVESLTACS
jgi:hypothetical protein